MTIEDKDRGWWGVPGGTHWKCPECGQTSPIEQWREVEPYCEECGNHDGRECPACQHWFDHVWNDRLAEAQKADEQRTETAK